VRPWSRLIVLAVLALSLGSCSTGTRLVRAWRDPAITAPPARKVLVLAISRSSDERRIYEQALGMELAKRGVEVVYGTEMFADGLPDSDTVRDQVRATGADLAIVGREVDFAGDAHATGYAPGTAGYASGASAPPDGGGFFGWASACWTMVQDTGYLQHSTSVRIETLAYDLRSLRLVWSGVTRGTDPRTASESMGSIGPAVIGGLRRQHLVH